MRQLLSLFLACCLFGLGACRAIIEIENDEVGKATATVEIDPLSESPADDSATSLGRGTLTLEDGSVFDGEFYDSDDDGQPDKFKPDAGQTGSGGKYGATSGSDWFDLTVSGR